MRRLARRHCVAIAAGTALLVLAGCGGGDEPDGGGDADGAPSESPVAAGCGGGDVETQVVEAAEGVQLTIPSDWTTEVYGDGLDVRLLGSGDADIEGQLVVEDTGQSVEEVLADVERLNAFADKSGEEEIELEGFDTSRLVTFEDPDDSVVSTNVVGVSDDGVRAIVYVIVEDAPDQQDLVDSCLGTLVRTSG